MRHTPKKVICRRIRCMDPVVAYGMCQRHNDDPRYVVPSGATLEAQAAKQAQRDAKAAEQAAVVALRAQVKAEQAAKKLRQLVCRIGDCPDRAYSLGLCRKHYAKQRKYGDPLAIASKGGPKYTPTVLEDAGISLRQLQHWHRQGYLRAPLDPQGNRRAWNATEVRVALVIDRLIHAGFVVEAAAKIAREVVEGRQENFRLGLRLTLRVQEGPEAAEVSPW